MGALADAAEDPGPLRGVRILVPRGGGAGARASASIRALGGVPLEAPLIEIVPPSEPGPLIAAAERWNLGEYDWLAVTSANGAAAAADAGARPRPDRRVAAVGPATAEALRARSFEVAAAPERDYSGSGLAAALLDVIGPASGRPSRILLPLSEIADDTLERALRDAGHCPERVTAYRTIPAPPATEAEAAVADGVVDAILVTSGSVAREVARRFPALPAAVVLAAIGEPTARALERCGIPAHVVADEHTVPGLLAALAAALKPASTDPAATARDAPGPAGRHSAPQTSEPAEGNDP
ncbi:uroporphyrinogen-III synthase [Leucobacter sp. CSA1]|uniref:Uroporphyrinogen-III synthase n=1 Tax=Leucobacter chromiisoli TaxID=2796471 RepID=A0A934Q592_9MICO|nr:uroporphyrinogen-III synthase [Leucobacter chromiisoli]MBK0417821.1 uroporphyrinogen-III synthase [Leucobacter chromiisoli]